MVKLQADLEKEHPSLLIGPCSLHQFTLLIRDICSFVEASTLMKENSAIIRFFTTSHIWKARLGDIRKLENVIRGLRSEVATRWYHIGHLLRALIGHEYNVYLFTYSQIH
ncbi:hypothetical protein BT69DRAFT_1219756 [Atractiella rhizophila]|nr:hypothetical protein BT69DRAFT_1219756 [Atractiella rhizophila]